MSIVNPCGKSNTCPICYHNNLEWFLNHNNSDVEVFSCKHFTCKICYTNIKNN